MELQLHKQLTPRTFFTLPTITRSRSAAVCENSMSGMSPPSAASTDGGEGDGGGGDATAATAAADPLGFALLAVTIWKCAYFVIVATVQWGAKMKQWTRARIYTYACT